MRTIFKIILVIFLCLGLLIGGTFAYLHFFGLDVKKVTYVQAVQQQSSTTSSAQCSTYNFPFDGHVPNATFTWKGNGTISIVKFLQWWNSLNNNTSAQINLPSMVLSNNYTIRATEVIVSIQDNPTGVLINAKFLGTFTMNASWGNVDTNEVDLTFDYLC